ncbi:beta-lactamase-like protein [Protomyces lactucae-debilis]|uniref:Beta-lactamase-like protein n=1 Tax=Protomyces lactucae-debilis TaxID=2754530 RepID=A0A1Y2FE70_PROLT|nr:beta-lactamase-like protein [Protomyces lactucae-debilis]ORY81917.1 beta-lactamase-like protein [Protomyces lactucae-debilis]
MHTHAQHAQKKLTPSFSSKTKQIDAIDVTFLGTASAVPSATRAHSSLAVRMAGEIWLFDAGEGVQLQLYKSSLKPGHVQRIFITHMHGDHVFGLPPLVASLAQAQEAEIDANAPARVALEIYGPRGLRAYLRNALRYTYTMTSGLWCVHELLLPGESPILSAEQHEKDKHSCEAVGKTLYASQTQGTILFHDILQSPHPHVCVHAAPIKHSCPCLGFVLVEEDVAGSIPSTMIQAIQRNAAAIKADWGLAQPMSLLQRIKEGESITCPDGTLLEPPPRQQGRKLVILGDTFDPSNITPLAMDADLLIHEATNAYLPGVPGAEVKDSDTAASVQATARAHGHSTPDLAGAFAKRIRAKQLIMNHFSSRYKGDMADAEAAVIMDAIRQRAVDTFGSDEVMTAYDWMNVVVRRSKR